MVLVETMVWKKVSILPFLQYSSGIYSMVPINGSVLPRCPQLRLDAGVEELSPWLLSEIQAGTKVNYYSFGQKWQSRQESTVDRWLATTDSQRLSTIFAGWLQLNCSDIAYETVADYMADTQCHRQHPRNWKRKPHTDSSTVTTSQWPILSWAPSNSNKPGVEVVGYEVLSNNYLDFRFSDHRPVTSHFEISSNWTYINKWTNVTNKQCTNYDMLNWNQLLSHLDFTRTLQSPLHPAYAHGRTPSKSHRPVFSMLLAFRPPGF